ncbi:404_t:CDS:1, partial [Acaulospora morrowiae]
NNCIQEIKKHSLDMNFVPYTTDHAGHIIPPDVIVQLPLPLEDNDLLAKPRRGRLPSRPPNTFLIFKSAYTRVLQSRGLWDLRMREVTSSAAKAWRIAAPEVKDECRKLASVAKRRHEEVYGPAPPRRRTRNRRRQQSRRVITEDPIPQASSPSSSPSEDFSPSIPATSTQDPAFYYNSLISSISGTGGWSDYEIDLGAQGYINLYNHQV